MAIVLQIVIEHNFLFPCIHEHTVYLTVYVCVFAGMVPMQQQQQQQQQGFPMVPVMQPNMQGMMGMNFGGQMPHGAMQMQVSSYIDV